MKEAVIVSGARTPIGKAKKGSLRTVRPDDLGAYAVRETLKRAGGSGRYDQQILFIRTSINRLRGRKNHAWSC